VRFHTVAQYSIKISWAKVPWNPTGGIQAKCGSASQ
jgi:hypothetical protein